MCVGGGGEGGGVCFALSRMCASCFDCDTVTGMRQSCFLLFSCVVLTSRAAITAATSTPQEVSDGGLGCGSSSPTEFKTF